MLQVVIILQNVFLIFQTLVFHFVSRLRKKQGNLKEREQRKAGSEDESAYKEAK